MIIEKNISWKNIWILLSVLSLTFTTIVGATFYQKHLWLMDGKSREVRCITITRVSKCFWKRMQHACTYSYHRLSFSMMDAYKKKWMIDTATMRMLLCLSIIYSAHANCHLRNYSVMDGIHKIWWTTLLSLINTASVWMFVHGNFTSYVQASCHHRNISIKLLHTRINVVANYMVFGNSTKII